MQEDFTSSALTLTSSTAASSMRRKQAKRVTSPLQTEREVRGLSCLIRIVFIRIIAFSHPSGSLGGRGGAPNGQWFQRGQNLPDGSVTSPLTLGQAGGGTGAGAGGGVVSIEASGSCEVDGVIAANGTIELKFDFPETYLLRHVTQRNSILFWFSKTASHR